MSDLTAHLPTSVQELLTLISAESVIALVEAKGGLRVYIPDHLKSDHWLLTLMSEQDAQALCARYKGSNLDVPSCRAVRARLLDVQIIADKRAGLSVMAIAQKRKLSWRRIYIALARADAPVAAPAEKEIDSQWQQLRLFD